MPCLINILLLANREKSLLVFMLAKLEALVFLGKEAFENWNHIKYTSFP